MFLAQKEKAIAVIGGSNPDFSAQEAAAALMSLTSKPPGTIEKSTHTRHLITEKL